MVEWDGGVVGAYISRRVSSTLIVIPLVISN